MNIALTEGFLENFHKDVFHNNTLEDIPIAKMRVKIDKLIGRVSEYHQKTVIRALLDRGHITKYKGKTGIFLRNLHYVRGESNGKTNSEEYLHSREI